MDEYDCELCGTPWGDIHGDVAEFAAEFRDCPVCGWQTCELCRYPGAAHADCPGNSDLEK